MVSAEMSVDELRRLVEAQARGEHVSGVTVEDETAATALDGRRSKSSLFSLLTLGDGTVVELEWL